MSGLSGEHESASIDREYLYAARCIGNVTHDVNNHLGAIMAFAELIGEEVEGSEDVQGMVRDLLDSVRKSSNLLDTIAGMLGTDKGKVVTVDVAELLGKVSDLYAHEFKRVRIAFELNVQGDEFLISGVRRRLSRLFMLVLRDAIERVAPAKRKSIRVRIHADPDALRVVFRDSGKSPPVIADRSESAEEMEGQAFDLLARAREHARYHEGDLAVEAEAGLVLRLPKHNGLED